MPSTTPQTAARSALEPHHAGHVQGAPCISPCPVAQAYNRWAASGVVRDELEHLVSIAYTIPRW